MRSEIAKQPDAILYWLVIQQRDNGVWDVQGLASSKEKATAMCRNANYGICPMMLDESFQHESIEMENDVDIFFPLA